MIEFDRYEGDGEARRFLQLVDDFITKRGYPNAVALLIVPLMEDGFGILGATRGAERMTREQAIEYLVACADCAKLL